MVVQKSVVQSMPEVTYRYLSGKLPGCESQSLRNGNNHSARYKVGSIANPSLLVVCMQALFFNNKFGNLILVNNFVEVENCCWLRCGDGF